jgi:hypothetical protein
MGGRFQEISRYRIGQIRGRQRPGSYAPHFRRSNPISQLPKAAVPLKLRLWQLRGGKRKVQFRVAFGGNGRAHGTKWDDPRTVVADLGQIGQLFGDLY